MQYFLFIHVDNSNEAIRYITYYTMQSEYEPQTQFTNKATCYTSNLYEISITWNMYEYSLFMYDRMHVRVSHEAKTMHSLNDLPVRGCERFSTG